MNTRSPGPIRLAAVLLLLCCWACSLPAATEVLPPAPKKYFNDYAGVVSPGTADELNRTLEQFERDHSSQILVAVYPKMQSSSSVQDFTFRAAEAWKVGQKGRDNGAVLFVFIQDRQMFIQVGYGLEGAIPDALAKQIIERELRPAFRNGNYDTGLRSGVAALLAAARGEYKGTGGTVADRGRPRQPAPMGIFIIVIILFVFLPLALRLMGVPMGGRHYRYGRRGGWTVHHGGFSGGWGGGSSSRGGGGFSGGGGRFGGGGAGGGW